MKILVGSNICDLDIILRRMFGAKAYVVFRSAGPLKSYLL